MEFETITLSKTQYDNILEEAQREAINKQEVAYQRVIKEIDNFRRVIDLMKKATNEEGTRKWQEQINKILKRNYLLFEAIHKLGLHTEIIHTHEEGV